MNELNGKLAYVVGDSYSGLSQLSGVLTATQFFKGVLEGSLPLNLTWMLGQGLNAVERNLLQLCKTYRSEICFYNSSDDIVFSKKIQDAQVLQIVSTETALSKLTRIVKCQLALPIVLPHL